jgi:deoxyribodipyrimidine photo-lyase
VGERPDLVIEGMQDNARACEMYGIRCFPYVEPSPDAGKELLAALAEKACLADTCA